MPQIFSGIKLFGRVLYFSKISILKFQEVYRNSKFKYKDESFSLAWYNKLYRLNLYLNVWLQLEMEDVVGYAENIELGCTCTSSRPFQHLMFAPHSKFMKSQPQQPKPLKGK